MHNVTDYTELEAVLLFLDDCPLECEAMTQVISFYLEAKNIEHKKMIGSVEDYFENQVIFPHCWIELPTGVVIDFRLRMWIKDSPTVPHGIFEPMGSGLGYNGATYDAVSLDVDYVKLLTDYKITELL